jgi:hypothetical protein
MLLEFYNSEKQTIYKQLETRTFPFSAISNSSQITYIYMILTQT